MEFQVHNKGIDMIFKGLHLQIALLWEAPAEFSYIRGLQGVSSTFNSCAIQRHNTNR